MSEIKKEFFKEMANKFLTIIDYHTHLNLDDLDAKSLKGGYIK